MGRETIHAAATLAALLTWTTVADGAFVTRVQDTWGDGDRTTPAAPTYSENGVDGDNDLDLESAWYNGGAGSVMTASPGNLRLDPADSSASWTTHFAPDGTPVTLLDPDDFIRVTWRFRTGDVNVSNTSQNFRAALVHTISGSFLTTDDAPPEAPYFGYAMFGNMGETTGNTNSFQLRQRSVNGDLLSTSGNWEALANGLGSGAIGYADNTEYTFTWTITRTPASELNILMTMAGGNIGGTGSVSVNFTDTTPTSFSYHTFSLRPSNQGTTATFFDTSLFMVEHNYTRLVPEPATALMGLAGGLFVCQLRRRR
jgi:hypothetical protein